MHCKKKGQIKLSDIRKKFEYKIKFIITSTTGNCFLNSPQETHNSTLNKGNFFNLNSSGRLIPTNNNNNDFYLSDGSDGNNKNVNDLLLWILYYSFTGVIELYSGCTPTLQNKRDSRDERKYSIIVDNVITGKGYKRNMGNIQLNSFYIYGGNDPGDFAQNAQPVLIQNTVVTNNSASACDGPEMTAQNSSVRNCLFTVSDDVIKVGTSGLRFYNNTIYSGIAGSPVNVGSWGEIQPIKKGGIGDICIDGLFIHILGHKINDDFTTCGDQNIDHALVVTNNGSTGVNINNVVLKNFYVPDNNFNVVNRLFSLGYITKPWGGEDQKLTNPLNWRI